MKLCLVVVCLFVGGCVSVGSQRADTPPSLVAAVNQNGASSRASNISAADTGASKRFMWLGIGLAAAMLYDGATEDSTHVRACAHPFASIKCYP